MLWLFVTFNKLTRAKVFICRKVGLGRRITLTMRKGWHGYSFLPFPLPLFHFLALVSFLAQSKPKVPFLGISLLRNQTETLATQAKISHKISWDTLPKRCFLMFYWLQMEKIKIFHPHPSFQCCDTVWATYNNTQQTPQLWMEGTGKGCGFLFSEVILFEYNVSTILLLIVADHPSSWV